jgi:ATP-dependent RNA helicase DDX52/ROK1
MRGFSLQVAQRRIDHRIHVKGKDIADPLTSFDQLARHSLINPALLRNVSQAGYTAPTPIQMQAIPVLLQGRELLACAPTGSGLSHCLAVVAWVA